MPITAGGATQRARLDAQHAMAAKAAYVAYAHAARTRAARRRVNRSSYKPAQVQTNATSTERAIQSDLLTANLDALKTTQTKEIRGPYGYLGTTISDLSLINSQFLSGSIFSAFRLLATKPGAGRGMRTELNQWENADLAAANTAEAALVPEKAQLLSLFQTTNFNNAVSNYNTQLSDYNARLAAFNANVSSYNTAAKQSIRQANETSYTSQGWDQYLTSLGFGQVGGHWIYDPTEYNGLLVNASVLKDFYSSLGVENAALTDYVKTSNLYAENENTAAIFSGYVSPVGSVAQFNATMRSLGAQSAAGLAQNPIQMNAVANFAAGHPLTTTMTGRGPTVPGPAFPALGSVTGSNILQDVGNAFTDVRKVLGYAGSEMRYQATPQKIVYDNGASAWAFPVSYPINEYVANALAANPGLTSDPILNAAGNFGLQQARFLDTVGNDIFNPASTPAQRLEGLGEYGLLVGTAVVGGEASAFIPTAVTNLDFEAGTIGASVARIGLLSAIGSAQVTGLTAGLSYLSTGQAPSLAQLETSAEFGAIVGGIFGLAAEARPIYASLKPEINSRPIYTFKPVAPGETANGLLSVNGEDHGAVLNYGQSFRVLANDKSIDVVDVNAYVNVGKTLPGQIVDERGLAYDLNRVAAKVYIRPESNGFPSAVETLRGGLFTKSNILGVDVNGNTISGIKSTFIPSSLNGISDIEQVRDLSIPKSVGIGNTVSTLNDEGEGGLLTTSLSAARKGIFWKTGTLPTTASFDTGLSFGPKIYVTTPYLTSAGTSFLADWQAFGDDTFDTLRELSKSAKGPTVNVLPPSETGNGIDNLAGERVARSNAEDIKDQYDKSINPTNKFYGPGLETEEGASLVSLGRADIGSLISQRALQQYAEENFISQKVADTFEAAVPNAGLLRLGPILFTGLASARTKSPTSIKPTRILKTINQPITVDIPILKTEPVTKLKAVETTISKSKQTVKSSIATVPIMFELAKKASKIPIIPIPTPKRALPTTMLFPFQPHVPAALRSKPNKRYFAFPDLLNVNEVQIATGKMAHAVPMTPQSAKVYNREFYGSLGFNVQTAEQLQSTRHTAKKPKNGSGRFKSF